MSYLHKIKTAFLPSRMYVLALALVSLIFAFQWGKFELCFYLAMGVLLVFALQFLLGWKSSYLFYIIRSLLIVMVLFEVLFYFISTSKQGAPGEAVSEYKDQYYDKYDKKLGARLKPNEAGMRAVKNIGKDTIFNALIYSDAEGRRVSPNYNTNETKTKHAIFLGCSVTFGEGVNNEATIPAIYARLDSSVRSYNYGFSGYSASQMAIILHDIKMNKKQSTVSEANGFAVYTYIDDHMNRVYGGSDYLRYGHNTPDVFVQNGELVLKKRSVLRIYLARFIRKSYTLKYFKVGFTYPKTEDFYQRFASIINHAATSYTSMFPGNKFYVAIHPRGSDDFKWIPYLNKEVQVIKVPLPKDFVQRELVYTIRHDGHPTALFNQYFTESVFKQINQLNHGND